MPRPGWSRAMRPLRSDRSIRRHSRSEEHTSELQSPDHFVCRLLLEKKKGTSIPWNLEVLHPGRPHEPDGRIFLHRESPVLTTAVQTPFVCFTTDLRPTSPQDT